MGDAATAKPVDEVHEEETGDAATRSAAKAIEKQHLDEVREELLQGATRHERRLLRCVKALAAWIGANVPGSPGPEDLRSFHEWTRLNSNATSGHAARFLVEYMDMNAQKASLAQNVGNFVRGWRKWGIRVPSQVSEKLAMLSKERWQPEAIRRESKLRLAKAAQFDELSSAWPAMLRYMTETSGATLRRDLRDIAGREFLGGSVAISSQAEMRIVANKSDAELKELLLRTRALASLLRATGMRGGAAVKVRLCDFQVLPDCEGLLLTRLERKSGSVSKTEHPVYVKIVPAKDPSADPLLHLAEYLELQAQANVGDADFLFAKGFAPRGSDDKSMVSFATMVQRRFIAVLHVVAVMSGLEGGLGVKRLHAFRSLCNNSLDAAGASAPERDSHVGWSSGNTQARYYTALKHSALKARTPYLIAGRQGKLEPAHALWTIVAREPAQADVQEFLRTASLVARTSGSTTDSNSPSSPGGESSASSNADSDRSLTTDEHRVRHEVARIQEEQDKADPGALRKRLRETELELAKLQRRLKARRVDSDTDTDVQSPKDKLATIVKGLQVHSKEADFPALCRRRLPGLREIFDSHGSFGLPQSSAEGKALRRIILLAAIRQKGVLIRDFAAQSWLSWAHRHRKDVPALREIPTKSWPALRDWLDDDA